MVQPGRKEHVVRSLIQNPTLKLKEFEQYRGWINEPWEFRAFIGSLEEAAKVKGADDFVEIGVKRAQNSNCITRILNALNRRSRLTCIDLDKDAGRHFGKIGIPQGGACNANFVHASSFKYAKKFENKCAWVFIDGCHCFYCTAMDLLTWGPKVVPGGIIIFHDCDYRVQLRKASQKVGHMARQPVGVYDVQFANKSLQVNPEDRGDLPGRVVYQPTEYLNENFFLVHFLEGAYDNKNLMWNGMGIWRRKDG